jgi:hypothetical protein
VEVVAERALELDRPAAVGEGDGELLGHLQPGRDHGRQRQGAASTAPRCRRHPRGGTRGTRPARTGRRRRATPGTAGVRGDRHDGEGAAAALAADLVVRVRGAEAARVVGAQLARWLRLATLRTLDCRPSVNGITFASKKSI